MRGGDRCSMSLPVFLLIPQDNSVSAPTPSLLSHASICPLVSTLAQILVTFTLLLLLPAFLFVLLLSHFVALFLPPLSQSLFFICLDLPLSCSSSPPVSLPQDCCVYSLSRSPPVEDGDMPHRCGYRQLAVGITAATPLLRN